MILEVTGLTAGYGGHTVLRDIDLAVAAGDVVAVLGGNGVGKSTLLRTLAGLHTQQSGSIVFHGSDLKGVSASRRVHRGLALAPEGQQSFSEMSVRENLLLAARAVRANEPRAEVEAAIDEVIAIFPKLGQRMGQAAGTLSGGERQMVSISRALLAKPTLLMLDEPSHGLAPVIVDQVADAIEVIASQVAVLLVEQNLAVPRRCATHVLVLDESRIVARGTRELIDSPEVVDAYLGI